MNNLLMISGDRSILRGKKGAFWYTLEEFAQHWDRIDIICPHASSITINQPVFENVYFHPSPKGLWYQPWWIVRKGRELIKTHLHSVMTVHEYPPFYNGLGALLLSRFMNIPFVTEVHHVIGVPRPASFVERIGYILSRIVFPVSLRWCSAVRCVSSATIDLLQSWGVPNAQLRLVPSFYLDRAALAPDPSIEKKYSFACACRLVANKGLEEVIDALAQVPDATLLIIGDGPLRASLNDRAQRLHVADRVHFTGWVESNADVYAALQLAHVCIMHSRSEGGPRSALEAMALGIPLIATRVGVMPDVVIESGQQANGWCTDGSVTHLVDCMQYALKHPEEVSKRGEHARAILEKYDRSVLVKEYAEFLILSSSPLLLLYTLSSSS